MSDNKWSALATVAGALGGMAQTAIESRKKTPADTSERVALLEERLAKLQDKVSGLQAKVDADE